MQTLMKIKLLPLLALMFVMGAFLFAGTATAYAYAEPPADTQTLSVDEVWLTGDTLHIAVTDKSTSESQTLELSLSDYAKPGDEYVTIQATDKDGRTSNAIQFKNPYYVPQAADDSGDGEETPVSNGDASESAVPDGTKPAENGNPFTPDGTGTVVDNATDGDGKEFFTVETVDGNTFYLIVDRQRNADNVYLLNAVTENDLASLAKSGDGKSVSAVETPPPTTATAPPETTPEPTPTPAPEKSANNNMGTIIFAVIAVIVVGGAGYYVKILRPKQLGTSGGADSYDEPDDDDDFDDDEEIDVTDDGGEEA